MRMSLHFQQNQPKKSKKNAMVQTKDRGMAIKIYLKKNGITQQQAAKLLNMSRASFNAYLNKGMPDI